MGRKGRQQQGEASQEGGTRSEEARGQQEAGLEKSPSGGGAEEVQQAFDEAKEKGYFGETNDPYDQDEYAAPPGGNEGKTAHEDRAKAVNPEGHGRAVPGHHARTF